MPMVRKIIWRLVLIILITALLIIMALKARSLLSMLFIAAFFGVAMEPAVNHLHMKRGMKRGAATGLVFLISAVFLVVLTFIMIPGLVNITGELSNTFKSAIPEINDQFGTTIRVEDQSRFQRRPAERPGLDPDERQRHHGFRRHHDRHHLPVLHDRNVRVLLRR